VARPALILLADDQQSAREATARVLREAGHRVVLAADGAEAVGKARSEQPDLLVIDVFMPGALGGLDVVRAMKAETARTGGFLPVLLLSARADASARVAGLRAGAEDFLGKPADPDELRARVDALLRTRRAFDELSRRVAAKDAPPAAELPGFADARRFAQRLDEELAQAERQQAPLALLSVTLDGLDNLVARAGRPVGDRLLAECARAIARVVRPTDVMSRAAGDQLAVLMPNTHFAGSLALAERIWREVRAASVEERGVRLSCDASVGVACYPNRDVANAGDLVRFVHAALARARAEGRGKICLYQHQGYLFQPQVQPQPQAP
jgi:diguanylate cyclase (GGDEF)-like protein